MACPASSSDVDGDCYLNSGSTKDCKDDDAAIHPNAQEVMGNAVDEDCDKSDALTRFLLIPAFFSSQWTHTGTTNFAGDTVTLGNGILGGQVQRTVSADQLRGQLHVVADVSAFSGSTCYLDVVSGSLGVGTGTTAHLSITASGTLTFGALTAVAAPRTVSTVTLACPAGSQMTVDWITLQNTDDVFPPAKDLALTWDDLDAPAGGLTPTVVRQNYGGDGLFAASDLGGVAYKDLAGGTWTTINGTPADALMTQADLGVWDLLDTSWGDLLALTGRLNGAVLDGGLWVSSDIGGTWDPLADTFNDDFGGWGKYSGCASGVAYGGGRLLVEDADPQIVYMANADQDDPGVWLYDPGSTTTVCAMPTASGYELPTDGYIGALARTVTGTGVPALVVGYRGRGASDDAIYLCSLPVTSGAVDLHCGGTTTASCVAITDSLGMDIRDLEVDPAASEEIYVTDGGNDPEASGNACFQGNAGDVYRMTLSDPADAASFSTGLSAGAFIDTTDTSIYAEITGLSFDPDSDTDGEPEFMYAFVPVTHDKGYTYDRIYRIPYANLSSPSGHWVAVNSDGGSDYATRAGNLDLSGSWIDNVTADSVSADPYPSYWAPAQAIDAVWYEDPTTSGVYYAVLPTLNNIWQVAGLDDTSSGWNPESDTDWVFWPEADTGESRTFQTTVVNDLAVDSTGNIWMPVSDLGLFVLPYGDPDGYTESDCLWDTVNAGGARASVAADGGSVWITMFDQGGGYHHQMGVFRAEEADGGWDWTFQGAGIANTNLRQEPRRHLAPPARRAPRTPRVPEGRRKPRGKDLLFECRLI